MQAVQNTLRVAAAKCGQGSAEQAARKLSQRLPSPSLERQAQRWLELVAPLEPTRIPRVEQWQVWGPARAKPKALRLVLPFLRAQMEAVEHRR